MDDHRRIALLMGQDIGYCRGVLRGIHKYAIHKGDWVFHDSPPGMAAIKPLREWQPHGIIAHLYDLEFARRVIAMRKPLVSTTYTLANLKVPLVNVDSKEAGRLAAAHFLDADSGTSAISAASGPRSRSLANRVFERHWRRRAARSPPATPNFSPCRRRSRVGNRKTPRSAIG